MNNKKMNKKTVITLCIVVCSLFFVAFLGITVAKAFFRPIEYHVRVDSIIFDKLIKTTELKYDLPFVFVSEDDCDTKIGGFGKIPVTAATITLKKTLPLVEQKLQSNQTVFPLSASYILPLIDADFSKVGTTEDSLFNPKLSVSFSGENGFIAENTRAIPVDGIYANQENYKLTVTESAVCTVFVEAIEEPLLAWCHDNLSVAEAPLSGEASVSAGNLMLYSGDSSVKVATLSGDGELQNVQNIENLYAAPKANNTTVNDKSLNTEASKANNTTVYENLQKTEAYPPAFVASVGDMMVARGVENILINDKDGLQKVFKSTLPILQSNDITIGNLEGVVTNSTKNAIKTYTFKFNKKVLPVLQQAGFNYFMQTNNHCYDYGETGFLDTLKAFEEYSVPSSGIGKNADEAKQFYHTEVNGQKFAIISCGAYPIENSGFNGKKTATATDERAGILWLTDEVYDLVKAEKEQGYFVIVNVHGGEEYVFKPNKTQKETYKKLCDSGADVVFGSHPHVLQPHEWYNGSLIVYSLGNFVFNGMEGMFGATNSEIVRLGILNGKIAYCEVYPAKLDGTSVDLVQD